MSNPTEAPDSPRWESWCFGSASGFRLDGKDVPLVRVLEALNEYEAMKRALALVPCNPLPPQKTDPLPDGRHWCVNGCDAHFVSDSDTGCSVCSVACSRGLCHMACRLCNSREQSEAINGLLTLAAKFAEEREGEG